MELVKITDSMLKVARDYADKINKTATVVRKSNFTALEAKDRYFYGFLGELAVKYWLTQNDKKFRHDVNKKGRKTKFNFLLYKAEAGGYVRANVCTATKDFHTNLLIPENKFLNEMSEVYIAVKIVLETGYAEIRGYATAQEIYKRGPKDYGKGVMTYGIPFSDLSQPEALLNQIDNGLAVKGAV